jgi:transposase
MGTHPFIPVPEKDVMIRLQDSGLSAKEISLHLGRSLSAVYRVLALRRETGEVVTQNLTPGRRRKLSMHDILV